MGTGAALSGSATSRTLATATRVTAGATQATAVASLDTAAPPPGSGGGQQQCVGGLEFGLENCLCDGARVGIPAGEAACGLVISECVDFAAFAAQQDKTLNAIQEVCDTFAKVGCASAADQALVRNPTCGDAVTFGTARCPRDRNGNSRAKFIFEENVARMCSPLCPNCVRG